MKNEESPRSGSGPMQHSCSLKEKCCKGYAMKNIFKTLHHIKLIQLQSISFNSRPYYGKADYRLQMTLILDNNEINRQEWCI